MYSLPLRRTILQSALRFLIDALTFMTVINYWLIRFKLSVFPSAVFVFLLIPVNDPSAAQVIRAHFHTYLVSREDADVVHSHLAGDRGKYFVSVLKSYAEHGVR
jgi:hypothetical protein